MAFRPVHIAQPQLAFAYLNARREDILARRIGWSSVMAVLRSFGIPHDKARNYMAEWAVCNGRFSWARNVAHNLSPKIAAHAALSARRGGRIVPIPEARMRRLIDSAEAAIARHNSRYHRDGKGFP